MIGQEVAPSGPVGLVPSSHAPVLGQRTPGASSCPAGTRRSRTGQCVPTDAMPSRRGMYGPVGVVPSAPAKVLSGGVRPSLGRCPGNPCPENDCPPGYHRVYGQCILDVPQGITVLAGRGTVLRR